MARPRSRVRKSAPACAICAEALPAHGFYVVRVEVFAEPSIEGLTKKQAESTDFDAEMRKLIQQMANMTADDLMDQVHRMMSFNICRRCQPKFLANPLGLPRTRKPGKN